MPSQPTETKQPGGARLSCPRCRLPLKAMEYENIVADMCESCWGFFVDARELETILAQKGLQFSADEKTRILDIRSASSAGPSAPAPCPKCGQVMERVHYDTEVHLLIDKCPTDGFWLDTGEIKRVQALAERSQALHKLLLKKLGLLKN